MKIGILFGNKYNHFSGLTKAKWIEDSGITEANNENKLLSKVIRLNVLYIVYIVCFMFIINKGGVKSGS